MIESLFSNLQGTIVFAIFLGILISVHEWGHFITAKKCGVRVDEFAIGFGPTLYSKVYNGTNYMLKLLPLGGFVRMAGDERSKCKGAKDEFFSKTVGQRALIIFNGPLINFVLAYVCFVFLFMLGMQVDEAKVGGLIKGDPAHTAGLMINDTILEIDSKKIYGWSKLKINIANSNKDTIQFKVLRDGKILEKQIQPKVEERSNLFGQIREVRTIGVSPYSNVVGFVEKEGPADLAEIKEGDRIVEVNQVGVNDWITLHENITQSATENIELKIERDDQILTKTVVAKKREVEDKGEKKVLHFIAVGPTTDLVTYKFNFLTSLKMSYDEIADITVMTCKAVYWMLTGSMAARDGVGGPVMIFSVVKTAAEMGLNHFIYILGLVSASLAIFNLMPVIPLDGGHLFLLAIEKVRGKELPAKIEELISYTGLVAIIALALFIFYIDFDRIGLFESIGNLIKKVN